MISSDLKTIGKYVYKCDDINNFIDGADELQKTTEFHNDIGPSQYETWPQIFVDINNKVIFACNHAYKPEIKRVNIKELLSLNIYDFL
jgi:hypothetical protein